jgi:hypothetical protein
MAKHLILHVGFHKTGTSSLQVTCRENLEALVKQGYHYPCFTFEGREMFNHSIPIYSLFCEDASQYHINIKWGYADKSAALKASFAKQLEIALKNSDRIIFSGEDISLLPVSGLRALRQHLEERGFHIRLLCSVRRPYSFTCSHLQQQVKGGGISSFIKETIPSKTRHINNLLEVFDDIEFTSFEQDCIHPGGPVPAILGRMGIDTKGIGIHNVNEGIGNLSTRLYARINAQYPIVKDGLMNKHGRDRAVIDFDDKKFFLTRAELEVMRDQLDHENSRLATLLGPEFKDLDYPISEQLSITKEQAIEIMKHAPRPVHVTDAVSAFLAEHTDGTWSLTDLL